MSNFTLFGWIFFALVVIFLVIPTATYMVSKSYHDAKNRSKKESFHTMISKNLKGGNEHGEEEE